MASPGISYVDIDRVTIAVQLPNTGNLKIIPTFVVEISLVKVGRACVCVSHPVNFQRPFRVMKFAEFSLMPALASSADAKAK